MTGREVLAFDLYGTLVDPIAISSELGQVFGDSDGREAAGPQRTWRAACRLAGTADEGMAGARG